MTMDAVANAINKKLHDLDYELKESNDK